MASGASGRCYFVDASNAGGVHDMKAYLNGALHADVMANGTIIEDGKWLADGAYTTDFDHLLTPIEGECDASEAKIASFNKRQKSKRTKAIGRKVHALKIYNHPIYKY